VGKLNRKGVGFSDLIIEVFRVNHLLLDAGDRLTKPVGLSSARWQVLGVVEHGPATVAHVARTMGLTRQSVQQTADSLAEDGLIEYEDNPHHRRAMLMKVTSKGRKALDYVVPRQAVWANEIGGMHSQKDLHTALTVLREIRVNLEQRKVPSAVLEVRKIDR
jgi:DNA-binding MarR family transcriptional regulator